MMEFLVVMLRVAGFIFVGYIAGRAWKVYQEKESGGDRE